MRSGSSGSAAPPTSSAGRCGSASGHTRSSPSRPRGFAGIDDDPVDVWVPLEARQRIEDWRTGNHYFGLRALVRLKPGVDRARVEAHASQVFNVAQRIDRPARRSTRTSASCSGPCRPASPRRARRRRRCCWPSPRWPVLVLLMACGNVAQPADPHRPAPDGGAVAQGRARRRPRTAAARSVPASGDPRRLWPALPRSAWSSRSARSSARRSCPPTAATVAPMDARLTLLTVLICAAVALLLGSVPALRLTSMRVLVPGKALRATNPSSRCSSRSSRCRWRSRCPCWSARCCSPSASGRSRTSTSASTWAASSS